MAPRPSLLSIASHFFLPRFPLSDTRTELVQTEEEDGLVDLEAQDSGLDEAQGLAVDLDEALALLAVRDSSGGLLLAEALDRLNGRHFCDCVTKRSVGRSIRSRRASLGWSSVGSRSSRFAIGGIHEAHNSRGSQAWRRGSSRVWKPPFIQTEHADCYGIKQLHTMFH